VDDQVIQKADGYPTYHMAVVVDDHLMRISHIIRGEEWINSVPKHILLYRKLGWKPPVLCHLPLLRNPDKSKLSKRKNPTSIGFYRDSGFLPEAVLNYLGMMGWSMPDGREKFTREEMVERFSLEDINLGGPVFDVDKLRWLNAKYIREDYTPGQLVDLLEGWRLNRPTLEAIAEMAQGRLQTLSDWGPLTSFFFSDRLDPDPELLVLKGMDSDGSRDVLQMVVWELEKLREFTSESVGECLRTASEALELKLRDLTAPLYVAVSGSTSSTPLFRSMEVLGADVSRMRIRRAIDALGGMSRKRAKKLDKRYRQLFQGR
jgi:glutamyl-tRNA synthetase